MASHERRSALSLYATDDFGSFPFFGFENPWRATEY